MAWCSYKVSGPRPCTLLQIRPIEQCLHVVTQQSWENLHQLPVQAEVWNQRCYLCTIVFLESFVTDGLIKLPDNVRTLAFHPLNQKRNGPVTVSVHSQVLSGFFREWRGLYIWRVFRHSWLSFQSVTFSPHSSGVMVVIQRFSDCAVACPNIWIHIPSSGGFWTNIDEIPKHGNILGVTQFLWGLMKITWALGTYLWTPNLKLDKW